MCQNENFHLNSSKYWWLILNETWCHTQSKKNKILLTLWASFQKEQRKAWDSWQRTRQLLSVYSGKKLCCCCLRSRDVTDIFRTCGRACLSTHLAAETVTTATHPRLVTIKPQYFALKKLFWIFIFKGKRRKTQDWSKILHTALSAPVHPKQIFYRATWFQFPRDLYCADLMN